MKIYAILLAGGKGTRFGATRPKQYLRLGGRYVFEYALETLLAQSFIERIALVVHDDYRDFWRGYLKGLKHGQRLTLASAGKDRSHSVSNGLEALGKLEANDGIVIHDAVRPYLTGKMLESVRSILTTHQAATFAIPSTDTLLEMNGDGSIIGSPNRQRFLRVQTPQCFRYQTIRDAFLYRNSHPLLKPTDEFGLVLTASPKASYSSYAVLEGDRRNIKITSKEDMSLVLPFLQELGSNNN